MNSHRARKNSHTPEESFDTLCDLYDYFCIHCVKRDDKGNLLLNHQLVEITDKEIVLDVMIFKDDWDLLIRLYKFPICGRVKVVQMVMEAIVCKLTEEMEIDLSDKGVCLVT
jgi:hypothetical protein